MKDKKPFYMNKIFCNRVFLSLFGIIGGMAFAGAQTIHTLSVQEALELAKKNNITVKTARTNLQIQEQVNKSVTADALPTVSGIVSSTAYVQTPVSIIPKDAFGPGAPAEPQAVSFTPKYNATAGVTLKQTLFDGQVFVGLKARSTALDYSMKEIDLAVENLSVNVYKVYYQLLVSKTQVMLLDADIARAAKLLNDTRIMNENGFAEKLDVDKAQVQLANLETARQNTETNIINGYLSLKYLIGVPAADSLVLTTEFKEEDLKGGIPMDLQYRYEDRYDYQHLQISGKLGEYDIKRYKAVYYPTLDLNGAFFKNAYNNTYDFLTTGGTWYSNSYLGLSVNVPIFSGFSKNANLKKARLNYTLIKDQMENLKQNIDLEVRQARNNFLNAMKTMDNQKENTDLAESVYNQTKKKFESGLASNTDVTNAQTDLIQAQTNYINALYTSIIAKVDYLKAIGKI
ncbi:MAG TPA: TolC family protein [Chitinophagaceae bacterium]|nr:TolC family protein [Chitinophagaceae bacterium]